MNIIKMAMNIIKISLNIMDILFFFLQAILAVGTHYYAPKHYHMTLYYMTAIIKNKNIAIKVQEPCFIAHAQMSLWSIMDIEEK